MAGAVDLRILAAGLTPSDGADMERLRHARRRLGHDRLVLFCSDTDDPGLKEMVAREHATGGRVRLVPVPAGDARACLEVMVDTLDGLAAGGADVRMHASGGTTPMACAALLACLATSTDAWFFDAGRAERLLVPRRHVVEERFDGVERAILSALDGVRTVDELVVLTGHGLRPVQRALARLRSGAVVRVRDGRFVSATPVGRYFRDHVVRERPPHRTVQASSGPTI